MDGEVRPGTDGLALEGRGLVLSASSVNTFLRCEQQWYYAYVEEIKRPPSIRQAVGLGAHSAIEHNMIQKILSFEDVPSDVVEDVFATEYDRLIVDVEEPEEDPAKAKDNGVLVVREHHTKVAPKIQPTLVEQPVMVNVNGIDYSGYIDIVDDKIRIRDTKTVGRKPSGVSVQYVLAMTGYALAYRELVKQQESEVVLDFLVRTREPYYLPVASGGPVDGLAIKLFARILEDVYHRINEGRFIPTGLAHQACGWCGYRDICPAYRK